MSAEEPSQTDSDAESWSASDGTGELPLERGSLGIRDKRSYRTWQIIVVAVTGVILGLFLGYQSNTATTAGPAATRTLPAEGAGASQSSSTTTSLSATGTTTTTIAGVTTTTTHPAGSTATTVPRETTTTATNPAKSQMLALLLPVKQASGSWTTSSFSTGPGIWSIGWAYACTSLTSGSAFQIYRVSSASSSAPTLVVREAQTLGSGVTQESGRGSQELQIEENPQCEAAVKVTQPMSKASS